MRAPLRTFARARSLRRNMSLPEVVLWQTLRRGQVSGLRFRRQHPVGPYILDFYCPSARLAIEVDGSAHDAAAQVRHDERRGLGWSKRGSPYCVSAPLTCCRTRASKEFSGRSERQVPLPPPARVAHHLPRGAGEEPAADKSLAGPLLQVLDDLVAHFLGVAEQHHRVVAVEEFVLDAGIA
jgi:hypothetical protein